MASVNAAPNVPSTKITSGRVLPSGALMPFALVTALFFFWGVPNNLNDILIRQFMKSFSINRLQAGFVQSAFYMGYFLLALPSALYMRKAGYKCGFIVGLLLFGAGAFLFWPAALVGRYGFFLLALFVMASGLAFLETASNTFIVVSGPPETSERRLNFCQAFNPLGSITGALIGTSFIFSGVELNSCMVYKLKATGQYRTYLHSETLRVVHPYIGLGIMAFVLAFLIWKCPFPILRDEDSASREHGAQIGALVKNPRIVLTILAQFFYVGAQVGTWSYFIQYIRDYTGEPDKLAGYFLTGTLAMFGIGRFASAAAMKLIPPGVLMVIYCLVNTCLVAAAVVHPGWIGVWLIFITSFFMSLMYPTIFAMGLQGLGADSKVGGSLIVMAIIGGAALTPLMGIIADTCRSIALAYTVPLISYICVGCYSLFVLRHSQRLA